MPKLLPQERLPSEVGSTFADVMLSEVLEGDDTLASFKFTRFNNYKKNLHNTLGQYEDTQVLQQRFTCNQAIASLLQG